MKLTFLGAAQTVTGSAHLLEAGGKKLLVDYGMFQGKDEGTVQQLPCAPGELDAVVSTHAHIDHTGNLPVLVGGGYRGPIYATPASAELSAILMADCAHIMKMDCEWQNRKRMRRGQEPQEPAYTPEDAARTAAQFVPLEYGVLLKLNDAFSIRFTDAGHILGSASVEVWATENGVTKKIVFSGDIGNLGQPILKDPQRISEADYVLVESTYGNRIHPDAANVKAQLAEVILRTFRAGGRVVIPAFAVGRTQELLYYLREMYAAHAFAGYEDCPVYLDSPLAVEATGIFNRYDTSEYYDEEAMAALAKNGGGILQFPQLRLSVSTDDSKAINFVKTSCIIISASGMCDAGRIQHHLKYSLWDPKNTVVLVGFQADGTLGRRLLNGEKSVKILGDEVAVRAAVENIDGLSAHADRSGLLRWLQGFSQPPKEIFVVHGEPDAALSFADALNHDLGMTAAVPKRNESADLLADKPMLEPAAVPAAPVTVAPTRTPQPEEAPAAAGQKPLLSVISLLQGLAADGGDLPRSEMNDLVRAADCLWAKTAKNRKK